VRTRKFAAIFDQIPCRNANLNAGRGQPLGDRWECRAIAACPSPDHAVIARELICEPPLQSFIWDDAVIIVTSAENGCTWDHVAPPKIDRWGAGTRVPTIIISPFAERHFIDHTTYDTTSILKLNETRRGLTSLGDRYAHAADLTNALQLK
jgi:hypothetical protein